MLPDIRPHLVTSARPSPQCHLAGSLFATYTGSTSCFLQTPPFVSALALLVLPFRPGTAGALLPARCRKFSQCAMPGTRESPPAERVASGCLPEGGFSFREAPSGVNLIRCPVASSPVFPVSGYTLEPSAHPILPCLHSTRETRSEAL